MALQKMRRAIAALDVRRLAVAVLLLTFVIGSAMSNPTAHRLTDNSPVGAASVISSAAAPLAKHRQAPEKHGPATSCASHCTSHTLTLPAIFVAYATPLAREATWVLANDQRMHALATARLERPPRI